MIVCVIEGFGLNVEPYISELCPAWAEFKQRSTLYVNNYSPASSTWQAYMGLLTGEYPAYSSQPGLDRVLYFRDARHFHKTFLTAIQANSVALTKGFLQPIYDYIFALTVGIHAPEIGLAWVLRDTPRPRLIWMDVTPGAGLGLICGRIRDGLPVREGLSMDEAFNPPGINRAIEPLLAIEDEVVVVCGDHGNSWDEHTSHAYNLDRGTIKSVLAIFNPKDPTGKVETRLTSHLDLVLILRGIFGWAEWRFSADAFERGLEEREFAYSRTCFALQGQFAPGPDNLGVGRHPQICITDGHLRVEVLLPIIPADAKPRLWERPLEGTSRYYEGTKRIQGPTERHKVMEQKLMDLERRYRAAALKYLPEAQDKEAR